MHVCYCWSDECAKKFGANNGIVFPFFSEGSVFAMAAALVASVGAEVGVGAASPDVGCSAAATACCEVASLVASLVAPLLGAASAAVERGPTFASAG
jgi:hypothetical protein